MNRCRWLSVCVCLLAPALALAQGGPSPGPAKAPELRQMYEDVEIMRRLLVRKLDAVSPAEAVPTWNNLMNLYSHPQGLGNLHPNQYFPQTTGFGQQNPYQLTDLTGSVTFQNLNPVNLNQVWVQRSHDVEGVYLKGQGVVFTVTLPPPRHSPLPAAAKAEPKPPSEWEQARQQLHGDRPPAADKKQERKEPTVADAILKVLADNGHHFGQLDGKESVTVVVTFRKGGDHTEQGAQEPGKQQAGPQPQTTGSLFLNRGTSGSSQGQTGSVSKDTAATARDHELLGDLHLKQGKAAEAVESYDKALKALKDQVKTEPGAQGLAAALRAVRIKLAQAQLAAGNVEAARQTLDKTDTPESKPQPVEKKPVVLPAKLIITAPKELLDLAGAGKISFEEFKKAATVNYLTFDAAEKKINDTIGVTR